MIKKTLIKFLKWLALQSLKWVFMYIDKDKNGTLSKKEIKEFATKIQRVVKGGVRK